MNAVNLGAKGAKPHVSVDYARGADKAAVAHPDEVAQGYASGKIDALQNCRDTPGAVAAHDASKTPCKPLWGLREQIRFATRLLTNAPLQTHKGRLQEIPRLRAS